MAQGDVIGVCSKCHKNMFTVTAVEGSGQIVLVCPKCSTPITFDLEELAEILEAGRRYVTFENIQDLPHTVQ